jgi:hypothetical protein
MKCLVSLRKTERKYGRFPMPAILLHEVHVVLVFPALIWKQVEFPVGQDLQKVWQFSVPMQLLRHYHPLPCAKQRASTATTFGAAPAHAGDATSGFVCHKL